MRRALVVRAVAAAAALAVLIAAPSPRALASPTVAPPAASARVTGFRSSQARVYTTFKSRDVDVPFFVTRTKDYNGVKYAVSFKVKGPNAANEVNRLVKHLGAHDAKVTQSRLAPGTWKVTFAGFVQGHYFPQKDEARAASRIAQIRGAVLAPPAAR